ncbi:MAG: MGMT family protein [Deltaproteobacteria bacterium]|nr:MGMT family protein [Deltaproteobacteria bacterium]
MPGDDPLIGAVLLPPDGGTIEQDLQCRAPGAVRGSHSVVDEIAALIEGYFRGEDVLFPSEVFDHSLLSGFQERALRELSRVPRGRVISYGDLAERLGSRAARAVGTAMARNPFPLVYPCHRVVRASGEPGNFGGGPGLKRALLVLEGIPFDDAGRIDPRYFR